MTKFCVVAPVNILKGLNAHGMLGIHHLLLAHDVAAAKHADDYGNIFGNRKWDDSQLVIMDNSVIETGNAVDLLMMAEAIEIAQPTCVVLPDVLLDGTQTANNCLDALKHWPQQLGKDTKYVYIPQGRTIEEFFISASHDILRHDERITHWGVPRNIVKPWNTHSRGVATKMLYELNPRRQIHLMGFSDRMADDFGCASFPEVGSIDSAVPLRLNAPFNINSVPQPRGDWWENATMTPLLLQNLNQVRIMLSGAKFP